MSKTWLVRVELGVAAVCLLAACQRLSDAAAECTASSDCPAAQACVEGACAQLCYSDAQCTATQTCLAGICTEVSSPACSSDAECTAPLECETALSAVCRAGACAYECPTPPCATAADCDAGQYCEPSGCAALRLDGQSCGAGDDVSCLSGNCDRGLCCAAGECCKPGPNCDEPVELCEVCPGLEICGGAGVADVCGLPSSCLSATGASGYSGQPIDAQTGSFDIEWTAVAGAVPIDNGVGLSNGVAMLDWDELATTVTFKPSGFIVVRDGGDYGALVPLEYEAGVLYRIRAAVDVVAHEYSVTVTPEGAAPVVLAERMAFRTSQQAVTQLDYWGVRSETGTLWACLVGVWPSVGVSIAPRALTLGAGAAQQFLATVTGTSDGRVSFSVEEASGCGSVTPDGSYTAPDAAATCHVRATSLADTSRSATATVTVTSDRFTNLAACAFEPLRSTGTTYYFCSCDAGAQAGCAAGDDANGGLGPDPGDLAGATYRPRASLAAAIAQWNEMSAGDTIAFCRGGAWLLAATVGESSSNPAENAWAHNPRCRDVSDTCDVRAYDPPATSGRGRPLFQVGGGAVLNGFFSFNDWWDGTRDDLITPMRGLRFVGLELRGPAADTHETFGVRFSGAKSVTTDVLLCDLALTQFRTGVAAGGARTHVVACDIASNHEVGVSLAGPSCTLQHSTVRENGQSASLGHHNLLLSGTSDGAEQSNMVLRGNTLSRSGGNGATGCDSPELVARGALPSLLIEDNVIDDSLDGQHEACAAMLLAEGVDGLAATQFEALVIRRNIMRGPGATAIAVDHAHDFLIENNLIVGSATTGLLLCGRGAPLLPGHNPDSWSCRNGIVRNNTIYQAVVQAGRAGINFDGSSGAVWDSEPDAIYEIYNNAVYMPQGTCQTPPDGASDATYAVNTANRCAAVADLAWFANPPTDFVPAATSPLLAGGYVPSAPPLTDDLTKKARSDGAPDIGAFER